MTMRFEGRGAGVGVERRTASGGLGVTGGAARGGSSDICRSLNSGKSMSS